MKKSFVKWSLLLALLLAVGVASASAAEYGVIYRTDTLNLRAQGSSSSQWLGSYSRGTWVQINGSQNNFYSVYTPDGRVGYMSKNYIDVVDGDDYVWMVKVTNPNGGAFLNFRNQPSYTSQVLDIFYNGVPLYVHSYNNGWYCVEINGQTGYVRSEYVADMGVRTLGSSTVATIKTPNNSAMNMRSGPSMNDPVIYQVPGDTYVSVLAKGNGWWCVSVDGMWGFMSSDYLNEGLTAARDLSANKVTTANGQPHAMVSNPKSTQALNLRQYASTGSRVLDKLYNGRKLWVDEYGSEWCAVTDQVTGLSGYVMTKYITLYNLPSKATRRVVHPNGSYVNLRSAPDMYSGNVQVRVPNGQYVSIISPGPDWCKVQYNGYTGYMLSYFLP
ncbi:MAG: SH3 domain-containing protein [Clostridia bacterium]|nr:SH3 domain-containing protein [Clostridia bacterium]